MSFRSHASAGRSETASQFEILLFCRRFPGGTHPAGGSYSAGRLKAIDWLSFGPLSAYAGRRQSSKYSMGNFSLCGVCVRIALLGSILGGTTVVKRFVGKRC